MKRVLVTLLVCAVAMGGCSKSNKIEKDLPQRVLVNDKFGFIDKNGKVIIPLNYDSIQLPSEGIIPVAINKSWFLIDYSGKQMSQENFASIKSFSEGLAVAKKTDTFGYIDKKGKTVIDFKFKSAHEFSEGLAAVYTKTDTGSICGYINDSGNYVIQPQYDTCSKFSDGIAHVINKKNEHNYIDKEGKIVISTKDYLAEKFSEGLCVARDKKGHKYGYIDRSGSYVIAPQYISATSFSEGLALVDLNNEQGFIDKTGRLVISPKKYLQVGSFYEGMAYVANENNKFGYIDKKGLLILPYKYDRAERFNDGIAMVLENDVMNYINKKGEYVYRGEQPTRKVTEKMRWMAEEFAKKLYNRSSSFGFGALYPITVNINSIEVVDVGQKNDRNLPVKLHILGEIRTQEDKSDASSFPIRLYTVDVVRPIDDTKVFYFSKDEFNKQVVCDESQINCVKEN